MHPLWVFCFSFSFLFISCATTSTLSSQQRRTLQVKHFKDSSYNHVFRAFKTVLQDEGYIIKNQDMNGGLIVAHSSKPMSVTYGVLAAISGTPNYQTGTTYEVSVNLEEINKNYVESRVIIQKIASYSQGGLQGREVLSSDLYKNIYTKVLTEVARRKAQGK